MASKLDWRGPAARAAIGALFYRKLTAGAIVVTNRARVLLSVAAPPASAPGEPPRRRTGRLRASVAWEGDPAKLRVRVGSNMPIARWLELGTRHIRARPWLRRALWESLAQVRALLRSA